MRKVVSLVMAGALALAVVTPAAADTTGGGPGAAYSDGMTITITSAKVVAKVLVVVGFDITCDPAPEGANWEDSYFSAYVKQASGRAIATGWVDWWIRDPSALCDGAVHSLTASLPAETVPFKSGTAAIGITGSVSYWSEWCDDWACYSDSGNRRASTGWVTVKLGK
jgi:hypothetical protein